MPSVIQTKVYVEWFRSLRDRRAREIIDVRLRRIAAGNPGQARSVGGGVSELKIDYGPGYRVYFTRRGLDYVFLLCGGDKSSQDRDIDAAKKLAAEYKQEDSDGA